AGLSRLQKERPMTKLKTIAAMGIALSLCACKVGPNYQRPKLDVPGDYRGVAPEAQQPPPTEPLPATSSTPPSQAQTTNPPAPAPPPAMQNQAAQQPVATPAQPYGQAAAQSQQPVGAQTGGAGSQFGELPWTSVFQDEALQGLIKEALAN